MFFVLNNKLLLALILSLILLAVRIVLSIAVSKKSIKKLVYTARIKRLFITAILILGGLLIVCLFAKETVAGEICRMLCIVLSVCRRCSHL